MAWALWLSMRLQVSGQKRIVRLCSTLNPSAAGSGRGNCPAYIVPPGLTAAAEAGAYFETMTTTPPTPTAYSLACIGANWHGALPALLHLLSAWRHPRLLHPPRRLPLPRLRPQDQLRSAPHIPVCHAGPAEYQRCAEGRGNLLCNSQGTGQAALTVRHPLLPLLQTDGS